MTPLPLLFSSSSSSHCSSSFKRQLALQHQTAAANNNNNDTFTNERIEPSRLLIGSQGEILDMVMIPQSDNNNNNSNSNSNPNAFQLALVTNSTQVRIINEKFSCSVLEGHKDIVLSVDCSPDG